MNINERFPINQTPLRMEHEDPILYTTMCNRMLSWFPLVGHEYVVVCIGTDRSTGDALGPMVGSIFTKMNPRILTVYGTLHEPVHAKNLHNYIDAIHIKHKNPYIIAIDACLGKSSSIGHLIAMNEAIRPGAALNKELPSIGDSSITGIVNIGGFMEYAILQNTRLSIVTDMANAIAVVLNRIDRQLTANHHLKQAEFPNLG